MSRSVAQAILTEDGLMRQLKNDSSIRVNREAEDRENFQLRLRELYGDKLKEAEERLCKKCPFLGKCLLLPLTMSGKDCPYYKAEAK